MSLTKFSNLIQNVNINIRKYRLLEGNEVKLIKKNNEKIIISCPTILIFKCDVKTSVYTTNQQ